MNDFDQLIDRRNSHSTKWDKYAGRDILPFWIADMDFAAPAFKQVVPIEEKQGSETTICLSSKECGGQVHSAR